MRQYMGQSKAATTHINGGVSGADCVRATVAILVSLLMGLYGSARVVDPWAYFHPEQVKAFGCKVTDTEYVLNGQPRGEMAWMATAFAERTTDRWEIEIAVQPHTVKGRHKAEKACMDWQDQAEKLVNGVHKR